MTGVHPPPPGSLKLWWGHPVAGSAFDIGSVSVCARALALRRAPRGAFSSLFSLAKNSIVIADSWEKLPDCCHGNCTPAPVVCYLLHVGTTGELDGDLDFMSFLQIWFNSFFIVLGVRRRETG